MQKGNIFLKVMDLIWRSVTGKKHCHKHRREAKRQDSPRKQLHCCSKGSDDVPYSPRQGTHSTKAIGGNGSRLPRTATVPASKDMQASWNHKRLWRWWVHSANSAWPNKRKGAWWRAASVLNTFAKSTWSMPSQAWPACRAVQWPMMWSSSQNKKPSWIRKV